MQIEEKIKAEAARLGFKLSGICLPQIPPHYQVYLDWLESGRHAGMAYLARKDAIAARKDPCQLLPGCQSILCLGLPYPAPAKQTHRYGGHLQGQISAYALGRDYHEVVLEKLQVLSAFIEAEVGHPVQTKACVDTSAILEKDYAWLAGLGWIGRNSLLLTPGYGSYVFLAELLLDLPLQPDQPLPGDPCESCQRCIQACPTQAIQSDRSIDARRCLSYLTIEHRGPIPEEYRTAMGAKVFGCDICQTVCPFNQRQSKTDAELALTGMVDPVPYLVAELCLSTEEFKQKFMGTVVLRAKRQGYLRNVAIALGNLADPAALQPLSDLLNIETDPVIQGACRWALEKINSMA